jgi:uncharacterized membrane protein
MPKKRDDNILKAFVTTFLSIIGFIIAMIAWRDDKYVMFYAKQSLIVFIIAAIAGVINGFFLWLPLIGWIINSALGLIVLILWLISWVYALSGEMKEVPIIGEWGKKIKL